MTTTSRRLGGTLKSRMLLLGLVVGALVLAGCASNNNANNGGNANGSTGGSSATAPPTPSTAEARALLTGAMSGAPAQYGLEMSFLDLNGTKLMTAKGAVDNATKTSYFEMTFDPSVFKGSGEMGGDMSAFQNGMGMYVTKDASAFIINGTAIVNEVNESSTNPAASANPFGDLFDNPQGGAGFLEESGLNITDVKGVVWKGKSAVQVGIQDTQDGKPVTGSVVVYTQDKRIAHMEMNIPAGADTGSGSEDGFDFMNKGGKMTMDFLYGSDATVSIPESAKRAVGLLYKSDHSRFSFGDEPTTITWTFQMSAGVPASEVQAVVQKANADEMGGMGDFGAPGGAIQEDWHLALADGTKTQDEVTLAFHDNDKDGKVSKGDTLVISTTKTDENGDPVPLPSVILKDTKTGLYVTPGFELVFLVAGAALVALALRRRG